MLALRRQGVTLWRFLVKNILILSCEAMAFWRSEILLFGWMFFVQQKVFRLAPQQKEALGDLEGALNAVEERSKAKKITLKWAKVISVCIFAVLVLYTNKRNRSVIKLDASTVGEVLAAYGPLTILF